MDDFYAQLAKANAMAVNAAMTASTVNSTNMASIATGAMMLKMIMTPVSGDAMAMLRQLQSVPAASPQASPVADPFGKEENPLETDTSA
jgi:hypothetical protein